MDHFSKFSVCTISPHHCRCFEMLSEDESNLLFDNSVKIKYKKGEVICKQGALVSQVMYVENGLVKVFLDSRTKSLVLKIIPDGNFLGLASLSEENNTYQYSAMAYINTEVRQIDLNIFRQLLSQNPLFSKEIIDIFSANSLQTYGRFFCLTQKQSFGKLADIILCLSDRVFKKSDFELLLSRQDLAELTDMSSETVIRILKKFREDGLIKMEGRNFKVIDHARLKHISETG